MRSLPQDILATIDQREALQLRAQGLSFRAIADTQGCSPSTAKARVDAALDKTLREPADHLRELELERLDQLFEVAFARATDQESKGVLFGVDRCLTIMDRRARLLGLDAPIRRIVEVIDDTSIDREIERLVSELAQNDPAAGNLDRGEPTETAAVPGAETPGS